MSPPLEKQRDASKSHSHTSIIKQFCNEQLILIKKTERSDSTNLQYSIFNIQFRQGRVGSDK
ncbi:hypothetical protein D1AOALGA4SA_410 [Olavius algarvensis Delta 1 endosymbiont]|nr:hypothetical protein D1AOALGA4SA_410 [Olavius algarvensis Delta 1 endosymbiont]